MIFDKKLKNILEDVYFQELPKEDIHTIDHAIKEIKELIDHYYDRKEFMKERIG